MFSYQVTNETGDWKPGTGDINYYFKTLLIPNGNQTEQNAIFTHKKKVNLSLSFSLCNQIERRPAPNIV